MLFREKHLKQIRTGSVTLAFRRWKKASVKTGSLIHTSIGLVRIGDIEEVKEEQISDADARLAGFLDKAELLSSFRTVAKAAIYKIEVSYHSADPRIALREKSELTIEHLADIKTKLDRFDKFSKHGAWTKKVMLAIQQNPHLVASEVAKRTGFERDWLKLNIRKLKNLGLTISHPVGYEISPLGKKVMEQL